MTTSLDGVEDVFFSMADMDMSHSLSSLPPLGEPPTVDLDLSLTSNYSASPGESPSGNAAVGLCQCRRYYHMFDKVVDPDLVLVD